MGYYKFILPLATTNLVTNPSLEVDATGYTAVGGSVARSTVDRFFGLASLAVTPTAGTTDGVYYGTVSLTTGVTYTFSAYVKGVLNIPYKLYFANTSGTLKGSAVTFTGTGNWQRVEVSWACDSTTTYRVYITKNSDASTGIFYIDGVQVEAQSAASTYCDGDQEKCTWIGAKHASTSSRTARTRAGGQIVDLDSLGLYVEEMNGIGLPALEHRTRSHPLMAGAELLGYTIRERAFQLAGVVSGSTQANLHSLRKALINALKVDAVTDETEPVLLRYWGANSAKETEIGAVIDDGMGYGNISGFSEDIALRLIAYDPFYYEVGEAAASLTTTLSVSNANYILAKINGTWQALGTGMNGIVEDIVIAPDGSLYACGSFTTAGGVTVNRIAKWNGSAWSALGTGLNGDASCLAIDAAGYVYVGGSFTTANGVTVNRIAKWNGTTFEALGVTGVDDAVWDMVFGQDGALYAGGAFHAAAGTTVNHVAKWDGSAWSALGTGTNGDVYAVKISPDGYLYAGGDFTTANGVTVNYIGKWTGTTFAALASGLSYYVDALAFTNAGLLYAGIHHPSVPPTSTDQLQVWNGAAWSVVAGKILVSVNDLEYDESGGLLYLTGTTEDYGLSTDGVSIWNGSVYLTLDVTLPGGGPVSKILVSNGNIYLGYNTSGTATVSYTGTVTNTGTHLAYPIIKIKRSGGTSANLMWIRNETTGKTLWFYYGLLNGEELTIDLRPTKRKITSSFFGTVWRALLRGSDFASFALLPGDNLISTNIKSSGSPTLTAYMLWRNVHWSADGVAA